MLRSLAFLPPLAALLCCLTIAVPAHASPDEGEVWKEWQALRADPPGYAARLEAWLPLFRGMERVQPSGRILTQEGAAAVREAIAVLRALQPLPTILPSPGITLAARDHVADIGPRGATGHIGADGSTVGARLSRHGQWMGRASESISFGAGSARETILELLVDDGVPSRGHREMLLFPQTAMAGVACGAHRTYQSMCVLDLAGNFVEAGPPKPATPQVAPTPLDDSKAFAMPIARLPKGEPTALDLAVVAEVNALRADPAAWATKLEALLPLFKGSVLHRPGRIPMDWSGAPESVVRAIAMLRDTTPVAAAQLVPSLAAGAREYVRVRALHPAFIDRYYTPSTVARCYGAGALQGTMGMEGEGEAFDIVAGWVVQGRGPNRTLLAANLSQLGVGCGPAVKHPIKCALIYGGSAFRDYDAAQLSLVAAVLARLDAARTEPKADAARWHALLPRVVAEGAPPVAAKGGKGGKGAAAPALPAVAVAGGRAAVEALISKLSTAGARPAFAPLGELQARARDLALELAAGRKPGDTGSWRSRSAGYYGQPDGRPNPVELTAFGPGDADALALRLLVANADALLADGPLGVGVWCGVHATEGQVCVVDASASWAAAGPELP